MLTDKDIEKIASALVTKQSSVFATKEDIADIKLDISLLATKSDVAETRKDIDGLRESIQGLFSAVDKLVQAIHELRLEYTSMGFQLTRHEKWIKEIAGKVGIHLAD